jgi:hypothetical protein
VTKADRLALLTTGYIKYEHKGEEALQGPLKALIEAAARLASRQRTGTPLGELGQFLIHLRWSIEEVYSKVDARQKAEAEQNRLEYFSKHEPKDDR